MPICLSFYKTLVLLLQVETYTPEVQMYMEALTYVNITKSPLVPIMTTGSVSSIIRGWDQGRGWMR
jgi:hypothetical protein